MTIVRAAAASLFGTVVVVVVVAAVAITLAVAGFGLRVGSSIALFFVIWWTCLFVVLPFGVRSQAEAGEVAVGTEPGAPAAPLLREKAIWTTLGSAVVLLVVLLVLPLAGL
jgi:predicted secreted protein